MPNAAWLNRTMYLLSNVFIWRKELSGSVCQCGLFNMLADLSLVCIYLPFSVLLQIAFDSAKLQQFKYHLSCRHRKFPTTALQKNPPDSYCNILKSKEHVYLQGFLYFFTLLVVGKLSIPFSQRLFSLSYLMEYFKVGENIKSAVQFCYS